MKKIMFIAINILTGLFVSISSAIGYGFSGLGEGSANDSRIWLWLVIWALGLVLQFKQPTRTIGLIITFIPVVFFLFVYISAANM